MKGKSGTCWIALAGVFIAARVCDAECIKHNFKIHITNLLLIDHVFQMNIFTPTGEEVQVHHELLSIINTVCSSLLANKIYYRSNPTTENMQTKVMWTYVKIIEGLGNIKGQRDTEWFCHNYTCSKSYGTSYINTTQFENIYKKVCKWNGTIPECPVPQSRQQTSVKSTNGSASTPDQNRVSQGVSSGLLVSGVWNIILILIILATLVSVRLYYRPRSQRDVQAPINQECMLLPNENTGNMTQDQNNTESHNKDVV